MMISIQGQQHSQILMDYYKSVIDFDDILTEFVKTYLILVHREIDQ